MEVNVKDVDGGFRGKSFLFLGFVGLIYKGGFRFCLDLEFYYYRSVIFFVIFL